MSHTVREKRKLLARVRRIKGQAEAIERALESEADCDEVMHLIAGMRGAISGLMGEVMEDHIRTHLANRDDSRGGDAAGLLVDTIRTYLK
ncbi:MAG TPA: metal/formaldehyde-sensitive transcriptional repressor [Lichenihabitans sp.]|jgi:DNA-binding FrmR family transcriptional regulator|nr:metal/formaldehyde-sensitive transcriptional repressor [Lichenihabitans sp.]